MVIRMVYGQCQRFMGRNVQYSRLSSVCLKQLLCGLFLLFFKLTGTEMGLRFKKVNSEQVENVYSIKTILKYFKCSVILVAYGRQTKLLAGQIK